MHGLPFRGIVMSQISLSIPYELEPITHAIGMLESIADTLAPVTPATVAPPPPVTVAPTPPVTVAPTPPVTADTDSTGIVWDARIHTRTRSKDGNGVWRKRRGVDATAVAVVEQEIRSTPESAAAVTTFPELMGIITKTGLDSNTINEIIASAGGGSLPELGANPEKIPQMAEVFQAYVP